MTKLAGIPVLTALLLASCSEPPKAVIPALTLQSASQLLHYSGKAEIWLAHVRKENPACEYKLELPDQRTSPTQLDLDHIVWCSGRPAPREFSASVTFEYDKADGHWKITRFSS